MQLEKISLIFRNTSIISDMIYLVYIQNQTLYKLKRTIFYYS